MALSVEVAGYGICHGPRPYALMIICVQQESYQSWTVYRRFNTFIALREQLNTLYPTATLPLPYFNSDSIEYDSLESSRIVLDIWLRAVASNAFILQTQSMYQFLCVEANQPPPNLEIHWRQDSPGVSEDEMEMNDMFGHGGQTEEEDETLNGGTLNNDDDYDTEIDPIETDDRLKSLPPSNPLTTNHPSHLPSTSSHKQPRSWKNSRITPRQYTSDGYNVNTTHTHKKGHNSEAEDVDDGLDIQSLSVIQAEFLYDKMEEDVNTTTQQIHQLQQVSSSLIFSSINQQQQMNNSAGGDSSNIGMLYILYSVYSI